MARLGEWLDEMADRIGCLRSELVGWLLIVNAAMLAVWLIG